MTRFCRDQNFPKVPRRQTEQDVILLSDHFPRGLFWQIHWAQHSYFEALAIGRVQSAATIWRHDNLRLL